MTERFCLILKDGEKDPYRAAMGVLVSEGYTQEEWHNILVDIEEGFVYSEDDEYDTLQEFLDEYYPDVHEEPFAKILTV